MKKLIVLSLIFLLGLFLISCDDKQPLSTEPNLNESGDSFGENPESLSKRGYAEFEIKFENLTPETGPGASQPLSPPVIAAHTPLYHVFETYKKASSELGQVAEDAVNGPLVNMLQNSEHVYSVVEGSEGPIFPNASQTYTIMTKIPFVRLSLVSMLVNTNDGFAGIDGIRLPFRGTKVVYLYAYDAGTERNTELTDHIPGPCCGNPLVRVPTNEFIKVHEGIKGNGDLDPQVYGWSGYVAKLTITRIK
jgi:hypothetical protein